MLRKPALALGILLMVLFISCKSTSNKSVTDTNAQVIDSVALNKDSIEDGGIRIFYNMYLSVEMSSLFKSIGASFNKNLINPYTKAIEYDLSTAKAVNLGVYAVDLSYSRYFDEIEYAGNYLKTMHKLAMDLGIPDEKFYLSVKRIEKNISNKDSLVKIANELYYATESYLKDSDRASAAALIVMGGWTEAMYIATNLVDKRQKDAELLERITEQKFSLKNLIDLLSKYKTDKTVAKYIEQLNALSVSFDKVVMDEKNLDSTIKQISEVTAKVQQLRKEMVG